MSTLKLKALFHTKNRNKCQEKTCLTITLKTAKTAKPLFFQKLWSGDVVCFNNPGEQNKFTFSCVNGYLHFPEKTISQDYIPWSGKSSYN